MKAAMRTDGADQPGALRLVSGRAGETSGIKLSGVSKT
jgi:hypothetical protein